MKKAGKSKKPATTDVTPLIANVTLTILNFPSPTETTSQYPNVDFEMSLDKSFKGASLKDSTTLLLRAERGQPIQINFRLAQNLATSVGTGDVARYQLVGLGFQGMQVLLTNKPGAPAPKISTSDNQFPSILGAYHDRLKGFLKTGRKSVSYSIPPHAMSVIDLNQSESAISIYSFVAMVQQIDTSGNARYGIIDPDIENEAEN